jgi:ribosome-associated toxin RatA of RatAB toxin-antitoxin module
MIHLEHSIVIKSTIDKVYAIAEKIEKFPEFMPHVKSSNIIKRQENKREVEMSAIVNGINSHRISASTTEKNKKITYKQVKGFCKVMGGEWLFKKIPSGTKITLIHNFDVGLSIIGKLIGRIIVKNWVDKHSRLMLSHIKAKAESNK